MSRDANFGQFLDTTLQAANDAAAFETTAGDSIDFRTLSEQIGRIVSGLLSLGLKPGDRVLVQTTKSIHNFALFIATLKIGGIFAPLHATSTTDDLIHVIDNALPTLIVANSQILVDIAGKLRATRVRIALSLEEDGSGSLAKMIASQRPAKTSVPRIGSDPALLLYAPSAEGPTRGIIHTHRGLTANAEALQQAWPALSGGVVVLALDDWYADGRAALLHAALLGGSRVVIADGLEDALSADALQRAQAWIGTPEHFASLLDLPQLDKSQAANLRLAAMTAPRLPQTLHERCMQGLGVPPAKCLSLPETGVVCVDGAAGGSAADRLSGPLAGALLRLDGSGPTADSGRLEVGGPSVFSGYWRDAPASGRTLTTDGYVRTRLPVIRDADGALTVSDPPAAPKP